MIDIVIPCYERTAMLDDCIESIKKNTHHKYRLLVVEGKRSAAENQNIGINQVTSDWFVMMDDDVRVTAGWLDTLLLYRNDDIGQIQPKTIFPDGSIFSAGVYRDQPKNIGYKRRDKGQYDLVIERNCLNGCCSLYNRKILKECAFDENYLGSQCEDMDFSNQIMHAGFSLLYCGKATVVHYSLKREAKTSQNYKYYLQKWYGARSVREKTKRGVLYTGYACNVDCEFCYYEFKGIYSRKLIPLEKLKELAFRMHNELNLEYVDITGGEPTLQPHLVDLVAYCRETGISPTIITNAQKLADKSFVRSLKNAGVEDFLLSYHGPRKVHNRVMKAIGNPDKIETYQALREGVENIRALEIPFRINTVVNKNTVDFLEELAIEVAKVGATVHNFINFNPFHTWEINQNQKISLDLQAQFTRIVPNLRRAVTVLQQAGIEVNLRYFPFCQLKGIESLIMNFPQLPYDRWEWDFRTGNSGIINIKSFGNRIKELQKQWYKYAPECKKCSVRIICDGYSKNYFLKFGFDNIKPYYDLADPLHFSCPDSSQNNSYSLKATIEKLPVPLLFKNMILLPFGKFIYRQLKKVR